MKARKALGAALTDTRVQICLSKCFNAELHHAEGTFEINGKVMLDENLSRERFYVLLELPTDFSMCVYLVDLFIPITR